MGLAQEWLREPVIRLHEVSSTNNYAMALADADKARPGTTVVAAAQPEGRGQRGKVWYATPGESLLLSIIVAPQWAVEAQFLLSASVAVSLAQCVQKSLPGKEVSIKWPNDILIGDKKAAGILIENVLRGQGWLYSVVGVGLNVGQQAFPEHLPRAISLGQAGSTGAGVDSVLDEVRPAIISAVAAPQTSEAIMAAYNKLLYRRGLAQEFQGPEGTEVWELSGVMPDGRLRLELPDGRAKYVLHGALEWCWG